MKGCTICGQPVVDRSTFCADCKAALERARDETVSRVQTPPAGAGGRGDTPPARAAAEPVPVASPARVTRPEPISRERLWTRIGWGAVALILALGVVAAYEIFSTVHEGDSARQQASAPPAPRGPLPALPTSSAPPVEPAAISAAPPPQRPVVDETAPPPAVVPPPPVAKAPPPRNVSEPTRPPVVASAPGKPASMPRPASETVGAGTPAQAPVSAQPVVATAAEPPADRWQRMDQALHGCSEQALVGRIVCEQKVRFQYCEGQWGQNRRCPGNPTSDHGQ